MTRPTRTFDQALFGAALALFTSCRSASQPAAVPVESPTQVAEPVPPAEASSVPAATEVDAAFELRELRKLGYRVRLPRDWTHVGDRSEDRPNGLTDVTVFSLPKVWSDLERQSIANAVSITSVHRFVSDLGTRAFEIEYSAVTRDIPQTPVSDAPRSALRDTMTWDGLPYEVQVEFVVRDRMGYVLSFIATPGTFDINYPKFRAFSDSFETFAPSND